ncbi:hypothetical protein AB0I99_28605, partial [Streptomyces spongiicola]|uniref:hypothetical protein n=1 Tax=Streptomyces spongiicola TaxID=1690221 RepID=UPI0033E574D8
QPKHQPPTNHPENTKTAPTNTTHQTKNQPEPNEPNDSAEPFDQEEWNDPSVRVQFRNLARAVDSIMVSS